MIQLDSLAVLNDQKILAFFEELGLKYTPHTVFILKWEQFKPSFVAMHLNSNSPVIIDEDGLNGEPVTMVESRAMWLCFAAKTVDWSQQISWCVWWSFSGCSFKWQLLGLFLWHPDHFFKYAPEKCPHPYPLEFYTEEIQHLLKLLDTQLQVRIWLVGKDYSMAYIAVFRRKIHLRHAIL